MSRGSHLQVPVPRLRGEGKSEGRQACFRASLTSPEVTPTCDAEQRAKHLAGLRLRTVVTIIGTRPQFIKAAVVSHALSESGEFREQILHTGQHYDEQMSEVFFGELELPRPHYNLEVGSLSQGAQTGRMLEGIEAVLLEAQPEWVLVYGDTNSTLAGALAAVKLHIPVAHVEAGLRSFNRRMPEEINRILTDHAADLLFVPTETGAENLRREGVAPERVRLVGDVMYDAALYYGSKVRKHHDAMRELELEAGGYILATVHRAENTDDPGRLKAVFGGLARVGKDLPVVVPLHPRTRSALDRDGLLGKVEKRLRVIEPLGYLDMVVLERNAKLIATDSGGVQKEAFFHRVPCVTLRDETEWVELVELGVNRLTPPGSAAAVAEGIRQSLAGVTFPPAHTDLYGGGNASARIVAGLL